ncbi:MAG: B12-binding domain-containing radical SAM protein [Thermodesulfobacteriota bacterium]
MADKKRLLLISPLASKSLMGKDFYFRLPTLGLLKVAALTPPEWEIKIIDEKVEPLDLSQDADLVGITAMTPAVNRGYEIADHFRGRGINVVMGGMHPSKMPEEALGHVDSVVIGEAEGLWTTVLEDFKSGSLKRIYRHDSYPSLDNLNPPDWELYRDKRYLPVHFVETTRGCPHDCDFCSVTNSFGGRFRNRPVDDVISEIEGLQPFEGRFILKNVVFFVDDNIISNRAHARKFLKRIKPYNLKWLGQTSVNIVHDTELVKLMADSGCMGLLVGFETLSNSNLSTVGKNFNHPETYIDVVKKLHDHGIGVDGSFVLGLDDDDEGVFDRTLEFINRAKIDVCYFSILTPYPGTGLHQRLKSEGRIFDFDWSNYTTSNVVYQPKKMSPQKLFDGYYYALKNAYSYPSIFRRLWGVKTKKNFFWPMNFGFRQSVRQSIRRSGNAQRHDYTGSRSSI